MEKDPKASNLFHGGLRNISYEEQFKKTVILIMYKIEEFRGGSYFFPNLGKASICERECGIRILGSYQGRNSNSGKKV